MAIQQSDAEAIGWLNMRNLTRDHRRAQVPFHPVVGRLDLFLAEKPQHVACPGFRPGVLGSDLRVTLENGAADPSTLQLFGFSSQLLDEPMLIENDLHQFLAAERFQFPHANIMQRFCSRIAANQLRESPWLFLGKRRRSERVVVIEREA